MNHEQTLALITDIHHGPAFEAKAGPLARTTLTEVLADIERSGADLLLDLGDRINNSTAEDDRAHMGEVAALFRATRLEAHHLLGNHDVKLLAPEENAAILGAPVGSRVLHLGAWDLLLWSPPPAFTYRGCEVPAADVTWLADTLQTLERPTVLFTHVPLGGGSMAGNYYFEGAPAPGASYRSVEALRELVLDRGHVRLAVAGHVHWNSLVTIDGVPFLTIQSLSELLTTAPAPASAWSGLRLREDEATLEVHGSDPWRVTVPIRPVGFRTRRRADLPRRGIATARPDLAGVRGIILDLDGVTYRGSEPLPGAAEFLGAVRATGRRLVAVTNHSGANGSQVGRKLETMGIDMPRDAIVTSIDAAVAYLQAHHPSATILTVGSPALMAGLTDAGFLASDLPDVVVVGYSDQTDVASLLAAARAIEAGAVLVATNTDAWLPAPGGRRLEAGAYVAMLTALTGRRPVVVGKPDLTIAGLALRRLQLGAADVAVVGDTLETDIATAKAIGAASILVLTGNTAAEDVLLPRPDWVFADLRELTAALRLAAPTATASRGRQGRSRPAAS